jgi:hypothetical protein
MTPSDPVERATVHSVPIVLPEKQIEIVGDEIDSVLIGLTQDLAYLDRKPDPRGYVGEVAAYVGSRRRSPGTLCICRIEHVERPRAARRELDNRNDYARVRSEHLASEAFGELPRTPRPSSGARRGRAC